MKKRTLRFLSLCLAFLMLFAFGSGVSAAETKFVSNEESADGNSFVTPFSALIAEEPTDENLVIVIDPGHGPGDSGALAVDGSYEGDLNLAVSLYCKEYLEQYDNVTVYLTHTDNSGKKLELSQRGAIAASHGADLVVSMHFNAVGGTGSLMLVSVLEEYRLNGLADTIGEELSKLGIEYRGLLLRDSEAGEYWSDDLRLADYYGMIRHPALHEIPSMIVEHCYIDNASDYYAFANTDEKLKALGRADAKAIIRYFGLDEEPTATTLENIRYTALQELEEQYRSMDLSLYSGYHRTKIPAVYEDAKKRIEIANNIGKIELTVDRAVLTLKNYPTLSGTDTMFSDVKQSDWFWPAVDYCVENKLFYGTTNTTFSPYSAITRGQFIAVLGRMEGIAETTPARTKFSDVDPDMYYAPHILWASEQKIVEGFSETVYGPEEEIRREDLLRMLHNYCLVKNIELPAVSTKTVADFKDSSTVDSWGIDAMNWAIARGIVVGDENGYLNPRDNAIRAEVAQIMMNFEKAVAALAVGDEAPEAGDETDETDETGDNGGDEAKTE